jgi:PAS domain S-box-containing protein
LKQSRSFLLCFNDAWRLLLGRLGEGALGRPGDELFASHWAQLGPVLQRAYDEGRPALVRELVLPTRPADAIEERRCNWFISPVFDEHGQVVALSTALTEVAPQASGDTAGEQQAAGAALDRNRDVTANGAGSVPAGQAAAALARSEQRFRRVVDSRLVGVLFADTDGRITDANDALLDLLGYRRDELLGMPWAALTPPEYAAADARAAAELYATGSVAPYDKEYFHKDGARVPVLVGATMIQTDPAAGGFEAVAMVVDTSGRKHAESALRLSERRFRALSDAGIVGVIVADETGRILEANAAFLALLGLTPDDLAAGVTWQDLTPPEGAALDVERDQLLKRDGAVPAYEKEFLHRDGSRVSVLVGAALVEPEARSGIAFVLDVSERKRVEQSLREREAQLTAFLQHSPGSVFAKDAAGRYQLMNEAFLSTSGRSRDQVLGKTDAEILPAELAAVFVAQDEQVRASGEARHFEETFVYDGREYTFLSQKFPLPNGGIGCVSTDITERKRVEEQLRYANYRFQLAEEAAHGFNYEWNLETGRVTRSESISRVLGYRREEIPQAWQAWAALIHPDDRTTHSEAEVTARMHGFPGSFVRSEYRVRHQEGHYLWVEDRAILVRDEQGRLQRVIGQSIDISERKALEAERERLLAREQTARREAEEASRLKDEFLATVSHELRTPLTAFLGYAQLLTSRRRDEAYVARTAEKMLRSAQAQAQLIEDLLDISRIVSGKLQLEPTAVDLHGVVRAALDTVRPAAEAKGLTLVETLDPGTERVVGDANRLQQVVWNLLANAVKFTPTGGTITVTLAAEEGHVLLTVQDTGQGISAAFLPFVFDRFRQADGTTSRAAGGLGLGLAIVRHLVELHGGGVEAHSDGVGQGATFHVRLPLASERAGAVHVEGALQATDNDDGCPPELAGLRVLLVDDQPEILELLEEIFAGCGASVQACTNAQEALATLRAWRTDVLVSDIAMPGEDGYWLIEQLRALPPEQGGATPAVALTAYVRVEDRLRVLAAGFDQYVPKPVEPTELRAVVAGLRPSSSSR